MGSQRVLGYEATVLYRRTGVSETRRGLFTQAQASEVGALLHADGLELDAAEKLCAYWTWCGCYYDLQITFRISSAAEPSDDLGPVVAPAVVAREVGARDVGAKEVGARAGAAVGPSIVQPVSYAIDPALDLAVDLVMRGSLPTATMTTAASKAETVDARRARPDLVGRPFR